MKVFISWSGDYSREVAEKLSVWIPSVIQSVEAFFSPDDIGKGENWNNVLSKELNDCNFGIICLTPENVAAPWIHFEAGALAKTLNSRLSAIMLGVNTSEIKGPLSRFQNTRFERNDFFKLVQAINAASDIPIKPEILTYLFDTLWERLDKEVEPIIKKYESNSMTPNAPSKTNDSEAIQEILRIVRKIDTVRSTTGQEIKFYPLYLDHKAQNIPSTVELYDGLDKFLTKKWLNTLKSQNQDKHYNTDLAYEIILKDLNKLYNIEGENSSSQTSLDAKPPNNTGDEPEVMP